MDKHVTLVGVLNIVYRGLILIGGACLLLLAGGFNYLFEILVREGHIQPHEVPLEILNIVPVILVVVGVLMIAVSIVGIIAAAGVLKRKEWARILLLVISFLNLVRIPLGTALGIYSIWVLMKDETIAMFRPPAAPPAV